jgi:hypothetical protein
MLLLNFAHPLTPAHREQLAQALNTAEPLTIRDVPAQFDPQQPFADQARALVDGVELTPQQWQTEPLLVNLPSLNHIAACVLAELHGRMGYFPTILRMRPVAGSTPPQFEVAEIINLQAVRDQARTTR